MPYIKRSESLTIFGFFTLILGIVMPHFDLGNDNLFVFAVIFFTGAIITSAIDDKKCQIT